MSEELLPLGARPAELTAEPASNATLGWMLLGMLTAVGAFVFILPNFTRTCCRGQLTACKSNLKNIATALEMYASDHKGEYPNSLEEMILGNYLKAVPTCPATGEMTYEYYLTGRGERAGFYMVCEGNFHRKSYSAFSGSSKNYPRYSSEMGLIDHP